MLTNKFICEAEIHEPYTTPETSNECRVALSKLSATMHELPRNLDLTRDS